MILSAPAAALGVAESARAASETVDGVEWPFR